MTDMYAAGFYPYPSEEAKWRYKHLLKYLYHRMEPLQDFHMLKFHRYHFLPHTLHYNFKLYPIQILAIFQMCRLRCSIVITRETIADKSTWQNQNRKFQ